MRLSLHCRPAAPPGLSRPAATGAARPTGRRPSLGLRSALIWWVAAWLLAQTLGHVHAVLHARPAAAAVASASSAAPTAAAAPSAATTTAAPAASNAGMQPAVAAATAGAPVAQALSRAFHPLGSPAQSDGGLCRLYAQAAQGGLAIDAAPGVAACGSFAVPAAAAPVSAEAAPRRGSEARGPPLRSFG